MTKAELRKTYKTLRNNVSEHDIDTFSLSIANQLLKLPIWQHSFYHIFLSIEYFIWERQKYLDFKK